MPRSTGCDSRCRRDFANRAGGPVCRAPANTDRIDLNWVHVWDRTTPPEEVLRTLADAVTRGQILYYGFSNTPSWCVAKVATLAAAHGLPGPVGLQNA